MHAMAGQLAYLYLAAAFAVASSSFAQNEITVSECPFVYGGLVYPEGRPLSLEHGLHWSKTQSK